MVQHPADRRPGVGLQAAGQGRVAGLLDVRAEEDQEERGRVDRAVVTPVRHLPEVRQLAVPHLVHDLAGLGHRVRADLGRLGRGERGQGGGGQLGAVGEGEERGEEGVAAQQGQEPRHSGRRDAQFLAVGARRGDLERGQVGEAPRAGRGQLGPAGREGHALRELALPARGVGRSRRPGSGGTLRVAASPCGRAATRRASSADAVRLEFQGPHEAARARAGLLHAVRRGLGGHGRTGPPLPAPVA